jgi:hypothetical protein
MSTITLAEIIPAYPLHWTTIIHYIMLLGMLVILTFSGEEANLLFTLILALLALLVGADLYATELGLDRLFIFLIRVLLLGIPILIAGMAPRGNTRTIGIVLVVLAAPLLFFTFFTCALPPSIGDPRMLPWC